jgi:hypothetical protein
VRSAKNGACYDGRQSPRLKSETVGTRAPKTLASLASGTRNLRDELIRRPGSAIPLRGIDDYQGIRFFPASGICR